MATATQAHDAIASHANDGKGWLDTLYVLDNSDGRTDRETDYVVMTNLHGEGFINQTTGLRDIRGNQQRNPFLLRFSIYTKAKQETRRSAEIIDQINAHWVAKELALNVITLESGTNRVGQVGARFRVDVDVSGFFDQTF